MKNTAIVLLIVVCVSSAVALSLLLKNQSYRLAAMSACQDYPSGCYMPPPSIHRLLP